MVRAAEFAGLSPNGGDAVYTDAGEISPYAFEAVLFAASLGIMGGYPDGSFAPASFLTRAEAAVAVDRLLKLIAG
jgi:hypothetical protein